MLVALSIGCWLWMVTPARGNIVVYEGIKVGSTIETPCAATGYADPNFKVVMGETRDYPFYAEQTKISSPQIDGGSRLYTVPYSGGGGCVDDSLHPGPFKVRFPGVYKQEVQESYGYIHCSGGECFPLFNPPDKSGTNRAGSHQTVETVETEYRAFNLNPIYSDADRQRFQQKANFEGLLAAGLGLVSPPACAAAGPEGAALCTVIVAGALAYLMIDIYDNNERANDPVDKHFRSLANPVAVKLPINTTGLPAALASSARKLFPTLDSAIALERAINASLNRAQGAYLAHSRSWERKQIAHARSLSARVSKVEGPLARQIKQFLQALASLDPLAAPLTGDQSPTFAEALAGSGPSGPVDAALRAVHATTQERTVGPIDLLASPLPTGQTLTTLADDPRLATALVAAQNASRHFAHAGPTKRWR